MYASDGHCRWVTNVIDCRQPGVARKAGCRLCLTETRRCSEHITLSVNRKPEAVQITLLLPGRAETIWGLRSTLSLQTLCFNSLLQWMSPNHRVCNQSGKGLPRSKRDGGVSRESTDSFSDQDGEESQPFFCDGGRTNTISFGGAARVGAIPVSLLKTLQRCSDRTWPKLVNERLE